MEVAHALYISIPLATEGFCYRMWYNNIMKILTSATKVVLLYMVFVLGILASFSVGWDVVHNQFGEVTKVVLAAFSSAVTFLFGHYFGSRQNPPAQPPTQG